MSNVSHRHRRQALKMGAALMRDENQDYEIIDPTHQPDMLGQLAGVQVRRRGASQVVSLSPRAARFYLDSGVIKPFADA
jgi:hypothetical protein